MAPTLAKPQDVFGPAAVPYHLPALGRHRFGHRGPRRSVIVDDEHSPVWFHDEAGQQGRCQRARQRNRVVAGRTSVAAAQPAISAPSA